MVTIEIEFTTGRFHATPWGRNVNEGEVEWPPSTLRITRAIIDVWKRRLPEWTEERIQPVLDLFSHIPRYHLPPATPAHVRCFMHSNERDSTARQKIFDAFVVMEREAKLYMNFDVDPADAVIQDLEEVLRHISYLGRSETWVKMRCVNIENEDIDWNCHPFENAAELPPSMEPVRVACLESAGHFAYTVFQPDEKNKSKQPRRTWVEAIGLSTGQLIAEGWSWHPLLRWVTYGRRNDALRIKPVAAKSQRREIRSVRYALDSNVLPVITETVSIAERVRTHLMGIHKKVVNDDPTKVSARFSGKDQQGKAAIGHEHVFILPTDEDGDGRIDHVLVQSQNPFTDDELAALDRLRSVWQSGGRDDLLFVLTALSASARPVTASSWISVTPFVTARHFREGRGTYLTWMMGEIIRECIYHGLPEPLNVQFIDTTMHTSHAYRWWEFRRSRKNQQPQPGIGVFLEFGQAVQGPFAIGALCHFGLGTFVPADEINARTDANIKHT